VLARVIAHGIDPAQRRLLLALAASALLHGWLAQSGEGDGPRRERSAATPPLTATLAPPLPAPAAPQPQPRETPQLRRDADVATGAQRQTRRVEVPPPPPAALAVPASAAASALPGDPTYYPARSLDVYPRALTALDLGLPAGAGQVRATVLIDESGRVNDVRAIEASAALIEQAARDLLLRTRFSPAAKDGRIVKAQVLVSLDYTAP
jgi:periplasmic protein TonB